ncbi:MAG: DUF6525 family protein [Pseudomonadota bacterium]
MARNCGRTRLKTRKTASPMQDYDRLPPELRAWMADAKLPWRAKSVLTSYRKAYAKSGDVGQAIRDLSALEARLLAKDAAYVWGAEYPLAA